MVRDPIDHERVSAAVMAAEAGTSGEIVTIVAERSDRYADIALHIAVLVTFLALVAYALFPAFYLKLLSLISGGWLHNPSISDGLWALLVALALKYLGTRLLLAYKPLRLALTPRGVKRRRVHARAIDLFKVGAEARTVGRTGILIYLSLGERMAEIVADEAIHTRVAPERWGDAMQALVAEVRAGRITEGVVAAVEQVGAILSAELAREPDDRNELPDRLIEL